MSNILNIGKTALNVAQLGIATTGHNIANAATPGYNRQVIVQAAAKSQNSGSGFVGQGAEVTGINRVFNETLSKQLLNTTSASGSSAAYYSQISEINNLLSDPNAGLNPVMTQFFSAVSAAAANPSDVAARQTLLSSANTMVNRFASMNNRLDEIRQSLNTQISASVTSINSYANQISQLNTVIERALSSTGNPPNDLMDQRDLLVSELSKQIKTSIVQQNNGTYNVFVGNGMPLVVGEQTYALYTQPSYTDPNRMEVAYGDPANPKVINSSTLSGGSLGGILQFRSETLDAVQNQIGQLATTLAAQVNTQLQAGYTLSDKNGDGSTDQGVALFNIGAPLVTSSKNNIDQDNEATASIITADIDELTSSDYTLKYTGGQYYVVRNSDKFTTPITTLPADIDGIRFNVTATTTPNEGDEYLIRAAKGGIAGLSVAITDVNDIALAGSQSLMSAIKSNDNTNGLALAKLQDAQTVRLTGSTSNKSFGQAFALMVSAVGTKTNEMMITSKADATALDNATAAMQSESGVNLDEEAANLLRYQQAYQAAGKMMQIASQLFEILLQIGQ